MKKVSLLAVMASLLVASGSASADWFGDRWGGNGGNGYNDWPVWTPMYWMEEMADSVDNNGFTGNRGYGNGYGAPMQAPYNAQPPYGYGAPAPMPAPYGYGAPAPMPAPYGYGAPMPAPYGYPAPTAK